MNLKALYQGSALFNKTFTLSKDSLLRGSVIWSKEHRQKDISGVESHNLPLIAVYLGHVHQPSKAQFVCGNLSDGEWWW